MRARVTVRLKQDVMDPQGQAVRSALLSLGHKEVADVRVGRHFDVELTGTDAATARAQVAKMADELLANSVIEDYEITIEGAAQ